MEVAEGVHRIDTPLGERINSLYLVVDDDAGVLFDTGVDHTARDHVAPYLAQHGLDASRVRFVVVSHADVDHFGGVASIRELLPHAVLACHRGDAELIESYAAYEARRARGFRDPWGIDEDEAVLAWTREVTREAPLDVHLTGGERIRVGASRAVEVVHAPGHSRGHLALWDEVTRSLVVADAVLADAVRLADGRAAFPPTYRFVDEYLATIACFEAMRPEWLLTAHYPTMAGDEAASFLAASRAFVETLERLVVDAVAAAGREGTTLVDALERIQPHAGDWPRSGTLTALAFPVVGHLERALATGRMEVVDGRPTRVRSTR